MVQNFAVLFAVKGITGMTIMAKFGNLLSIVYDKFNKGPRKLLVGRQAKVAGLATIPSLRVVTRHAMAPPNGYTTLGLSLRSPLSRLTELVLDTSPMPMFLLATPTHPV